MTIADLRMVRDRCVSSGDWQGASDAALRVVALPAALSDDFRIASGVLAQAGRMREALPHAIRASNACPDNLEFALHAGCVSNQCGDYKGAIAILLHAAALDQDNPDIYQQLAFAADQLGDLPTATALAQRAHLLEPRNPHRGAVAAHLLAKQERFSAAVDLLRAIVGAGASTPFIYRALAHYLQQLRDHAGALEAIDLAIAGDPSNAEYHAVRAFALLELGRKEEADAALRHARRLDPDNLNYLRHAVSILIEKNEIAPALRYGGQLLAESPDNSEFANCMRHLLETQLMSASTLDFAEIALLKAQAPRRPPNPVPTLTDAWLKQWRIVVALTLRDIRSRHSESRLGFFWVLMEPIVHIGVLAVVFQFTMQGRPPIGDDFFLFYFTGVMPYLLLNHLAMRVGAAVRDSRYLMQIASVAPLDLLISRSIVELFTTALVFFIFVGFFLLFGVDGVPYAPQLVLAAFAITWILGTGIGLVCAALHECGVAVDTVLGVALRLVYFTSGIFYVPGRLPLVARDILVWNPFLHLVDLMRVGYFRSYEPSWIDVSYAFGASIFALLLGLMAVTMTGRHMRIVR